MKDFLKKFLRDVYKGIYFLSRKHEGGNIDWFTINSRFIASFFLYYVAILLLLLGIIVTLYGPFKLGFFEVIIYLFGVYGCICKFIIYPLLDRSEIDEGVTLSIKKDKMRKSIIAQAGGFLCLICSFTIVYFLYKK